MSSLENFHKQIASACKEGRIEIGINLSRANTPMSPTYRSFSLFPSKIKQRTRQMALADPMVFQKLWELGALSLRLPNDHGSACYSPDDDFKEFVRKHLLGLGKMK